MEAIYHAEGRCTPNGATAFHYEYTLKDHLGNARVNFRANGTAVTFLEEMHYYPFGMLMEGIGTAAVTVNKYKYNGKELNDDLGLNWSDYGARWYDAAVGRWWSVDPLAEKYAPYSPYNYVINNPMILIDPNGMSIDGTCIGCGEVSKEELEKQKAEIAKAEAEFKFEEGMNEYLRRRLQSFEGNMGQGDSNENENDEESSKDDSGSEGEFICPPCVGAVIGMAVDYGIQVAENYANGKTGKEAWTDIDGKRIATAGAVGAVGGVAGNLLSKAKTASTVTSLTKTNSNAFKAAKTLKEQADDLVKLNGGKNSVTLRTPTQQIRYDLAGKAHGGVPTPHKQIYNKNFVNGVQKSISRASKSANLLSQQEIRAIRKYLEKIK